MITLNSVDFAKEYPPCANFNVLWNNIPPCVVNSTNDAALKFICRYGGLYRSIFEFGTWVGRSALGFSQNFKQVYTIDFLPASDLQYSYNGMQSGQLIKDVPNVTSIVADSQKYDFSSLSAQFDVVYVDGNHSEQGAAKDIESARLISTATAIIFVDDCFNEYFGVTQAVEKAQNFEKYWLEDIRQVVLLKI